MGFLFLENTMPVIRMTTALADRIEHELDRGAAEIRRGLARCRNALTTALTAPGLLRNDDERAEIKTLLDGVESFEARIQLHMEEPS